MGFSFCEICLDRATVRDRYLSSRLPSVRASCGAVYRARKVGIPGSPVAAAALHTVTPAVETVSSRAGGPAVQRAMGMQEAEAILPASRATTRAVLGGCLVSVAAVFALVPVSARA